MSHSLCSKPFSYYTRIDFLFEPFLLQNPNGHAVPRSAGCPYIQIRTFLWFIPHSALHYMECRAALNLTWFRAQSAFRIRMPP